MVDPAFPASSIQKTVYYCVELEVSSNPNKVAYQIGMQERDIKTMCTESGGDSLVCTFPNDDSQLFKFYWFLNNKPLDIQFWKVGGTARYVNDPLIHY